jgi:hypothetical protein
MYGIPTAGNLMGKKAPLFNKTSSMVILVNTVSKFEELLTTLAKSAACFYT